MPTFITAQTPDTPKIIGEGNFKKELLDRTSIATFALLTRVSKQWSLFSTRDQSWEYRFKRHFSHYLDHPTFIAFGTKYRLAFKALKQKIIV